MCGDRGNINIFIILLSDVSFSYDNVQRAPASIAQTQTDDDFNTFQKLNKNAFTAFYMASTTSLAVAAAIDHNDLKIFYFPLLNDLK